MRGADHLPTQQVRWWWLSWHGISYKMFLGDGTFLEEKKTVAHLADAALLSPIKCCRWLMREERGGEKKI